MAIPGFIDAGDLPVGVYKAPLADVIARFGTGSARRTVLSRRLERIYRIASETGNHQRFVIFGSFVTLKSDPNDVDVFMIMDDNFDYGRLSGEARLLFDHMAAQSHFGGSVFWIRRLAAIGG
jgi:hypothetical protein